MVVSSSDIARVKWGENIVDMKLKSEPLNDDTKTLTETDTKTFFPRPNSLKPKPRLFSKPKFSETETETFFRDQIFRNETETQNFCKSLETET